MDFRRGVLVEVEKRKERKGNIGGGEGVEEEELLEERWRRGWRRWRRGWREWGRGYTKPPLRTQRTHQSGASVFVVGARVGVARRREGGVGMR